MNRFKREAIVAAGWKIGDAADFLKMSDDERQRLDARVKLAPVSPALAMPSHPLTPALLRFLECLEQEGQDSAAWRSGDRPDSVELHSGDRPLSPIVVADEGHELTVALGQFYHAHFDGEQAGSEPMRNASAHAAAFVSHVLADRICITNHFLDQRCVGASHFHLASEDLTAETIRGSKAGLLGGNILTKRYLWSGPVESGEMI